MNSFLDQSLFRYGFDEAINSLWCKRSLLIWPMLSQRVEDGMIGIDPIAICFYIVFYGKKGLNLQRDTSESLPLADHVDHSLVPIGLEILNLEVADFSLS